MMSRSLTLDEARRVADAALACAEEMKVAVAVAVVDSGGHPVVALRSDGATFLAARIATQKAVTSVGVGADTTDLSAQLSEMPAMLAGISTQPDVAVIPGAVPLTAGGAVVGAVGVSGSPSGEDVPVSRAGAAAFLP